MRETDMRRKDEEWVEEQQQTKILRRLTRIELSLSSCEFMRDKRTILSNDLLSKNIT